MNRIYLIFCLMLFPFLSISQKNSKWAKFTVFEDKIICDDSPWILVFEDNFDGDRLDINNWEPYIGVPRDPNYKYQKTWHKSENAIVEEGILKLVAKQEQMDSMPVIWWWTPTILYDDFEYTSGEIWSKSVFTNGKLEARIKIPKGWGFCPALWMYGEKKISEHGKNRNNEIDVFEFSNEKRRSDLAKIHRMSVHYNGLSRSTGYRGDDFSADFHTFTMIWDENKIEFYVDGILKRTDYKYKKGWKNIDCQLYAGKNYKENKVFTTDPMNIVLNIAVLSGKRAPDHTTPFPSVMEVDYVRYFQREKQIEFERKIKQSVHSQLQTYPKSTLQDIYKNFFQDRFGPEHAIIDTASAKLYLENELASFETSNNVEIEFLGINHNYVRINLITIKQGKIPQEKLLSAFHNSAKKVNQNDVKAWQSEWEKIVNIIERMILNIPDFEKDKIEIENLLKQGKYAVRHSTVFHETYKPHYRTVDKNIYEQELKPFL